MPEVPTLIQCEDDGWAPWSVVCNHLLDSETPIEFLYSVGPTHHPEGLRDAACLKCWEHYQETGDYSEMRPVCMHCARKILVKHKELKNDEDCIGDASQN